MFNRQSFLNGGGENEHMISFGPEDWERNHRFKALGYQVSRVAGSLYHLDHWIGPNSSGRNPYFKHNHNELDRVRAMTPDELDGYVSGWDWRP
jgi:predicted glycosyltransferase involved in capsule biosynthesis